MFGIWRELGSREGLGLDFRVRDIGWCLEGLRLRFSLGWHLGVVRVKLSVFF